MKNGHTNPIGNPRLCCNHIGYMVSSTLACPDGRQLTVLGEYAVTSFCSLVVTHCSVSHRKINWLQYNTVFHPCQGCIFGKNLSFLRSLFVRLDKRKHLISTLLFSPPASRISRRPHEPGTQTGYNRNRPVIPVTGRFCVVQNLWIYRFKKQQTQWLKEPLPGNPAAGDSAVR